jgi:competence protein ComEC
MAAGIIFFVTRFLMAAVPGMALRLPIKKIAAMFAFAGALFYTLLAGAPIPAERSLIMVGIALLAIVMDRSPVSMRLVACAAFVVLLLSPDTLLTASFQLSFAAVAGLVLVFDWLRPWLSQMYRGAGWTRKAALYFMSVGLTTIIATVATSPLTVFHFQQLTIYGVISNAIAVPLSAFVIMPAAVASLLAMPFGLEHYPLLAVGAGCEWIIEISNWVAALPHALIKVEALPNAVLPLSASGIIGLLLIRGPIKYVSVIPLVIVFIMISTFKLPDILIAKDFDVAAFHAGDGSLLISQGRKGKYTVGKWESSFGLTEGAAGPWPKEGREGEIACDEAACRIEAKGRHIAYLRDPSVLGEECAWADVIVSEQPLGKAHCEKPTIDKFDTMRNGSYAIWLGRDIKIENAEALRGTRPWSSLNRNFSDRSASGRQGGPEF